MGFELKVNPGCRDLTKCCQKRVPRQGMGWVFLVTLLLILLLLPVTPGFTETGTREIVNLDGSVIRVPLEVKRVMALFGPSYEKVFMLNAEDKIIADGDFHINGWPWSNKIYQRLGVVPGIPQAHSELNIEAVLKLRPDVVFYWDNPAAAKLKEVGIPVVPAVSTGRLDDTKNIVMVYAKVLGEKETAFAVEYAKYFDAKVQRIKAITDKIPASQRPTVYFANQTILWTAGKASDIPELIELAGGNCVHREVTGGSKTPINLEQLLQWDPQYIFVDHAGSSGNAGAEEVIGNTVADARFKQIAAVKDNQVFICPTGVFFWDSGVQKILFLQWMAKQLHPKEFIDIDMAKELQYFYAEFFHYKLTDEEIRKILLHLNP